MQRSLKVLAIISNNFGPPQNALFFEIKTASYCITVGIRDRKLPGRDQWEMTATLSSDFETVPHNMTSFR